ncbi:MAG TPA: FGGY family carbohydrate kinase [Jatrophihabitans sp.]|nr:FGGY family carbohydrate kinase [Jatrophihabitans sp.]
MTAILAVDQGTSGTKAVVHDDEDGVLAVAEEAVQPDYLPDGGVEVDPESLWRSVLVAGRRAAEAAGRPLAGIALANQGETVLAWDPDTGRPLGPALVWQDRRAQALLTELPDTRWVPDRTGLPVDPYFSAPKLAWLRRHRTHSGVVTTSDSWLIHRLCGAFVTDASTASRSLLTGLDDAAWDEQLLELFGLGDELLPRIVACDEVVGSTDAFGITMPVAGLLVDQQAALLGQGCLNPGDAKCTFGTGAFLLTQCGPTPRRSGTGLAASVAWRLRGRLEYCLDGQVYAAGSAIGWLRRLGVIASAAEVDARIAESSGAALAVPALAGLAAPWWRADATGSVSGLGLATGSGELIRAVIDGIAAQLAELVDAAATDLGRPLDGLRVDGGLTQCHSLMQAVADLAQVRLDVYPGEHATALGVAAAGRLALQQSHTIADAVPAATSQRSFLPRWAPDQAESFRARWRAAVERELRR